MKKNQVVRWFDFSSNYCSCSDGWGPCNLGLCIYLVSGGFLIFFPLRSLFCSRIGFHFCWYMCVLVSIAKQMVDFKNALSVDILCTLTLHCVSYCTFINRSILVLRRDAFSFSLGMPFSNVPHNYFIFVLGKFGMCIWILITHLVIIAIPLGVIVLFNYSKILWGICFLYPCIGSS